MLQKSEALKAEYAFKQQTRIQKINYLTGQGVKIRKNSQAYHSIITTGGTVMRQKKF